MKKILYHATETELWEKHIKNEGIKKYDLGENGEMLRNYWPSVYRGIWMWDHMDEKLARECFLFQRCKKGVPSFTMLECEVEENWLLSELLKKKYCPPEWNFRGLSHPLEINDKVIHVEDFDICLRHIEPERIRPVCKVEEVYTVE